MYGLAAVDDRGRVADRVVLRSLGWSARLRLDIDEAAGVLTVTTDPDGGYQITNQGNLRLPRVTAASVRSGSRGPGAAGRRS